MLLRQPLGGLGEFVGTGAEGASVCDVENGEQPIGIGPQVQEYAGHLFVSLNLTLCAMFLEQQLLPHQAPR